MKVLHPHVGYTCTGLDICLDIQRLVRSTIFNRPPKSREFAGAETSPELRQTLGTIRPTHLRQIVENICIDQGRGEDRAFTARTRLMFQSPE